MASQMVVTLSLFVAASLPSTHTAHAAPPIETETIETHLYALKVTTTLIPRDPASGGAIAPLHNDLLLATPHGSLHLVDRRGEVVAIDGRVPMGLESLHAQTDVATDRFRVTDIMLKRLARARYRLFVTHLYFTGSCIRFRLSSAAVDLGFQTLPGTAAHVGVGSWKTIFDADPCLATDWPSMHESGGKMLMDGDEHLLVTVGNFGRPVQSMDTHFGKLLRIDITTGAADVIALGLRNAQGLARDRDGRLWETEHGPRGGDELNVIESGANYGWGEVSYGVAYGRLTLTEDQPVEELGRHERFARPVFAWVPSIGITSVVVNDERFYPLWGDDLLIGSLGGPKTFFRVRRHGRQVSYVERVWLGYLVREIRDIAQLPDGRIALWSSEGKVLFLSRAYAPYCGPDTAPRDVYAVDCPD